MAAGQQPTGRACRQLLPDGLGPEEFLRQARVVQHPMEDPVALPAALLQAMQRCQERLERPARQGLFCRGNFAGGKRIQPFAFVDLFRLV